MGIHVQYIVKETTKKMGIGEGREDKRVRRMGQE